MKEETKWSDLDFIHASSLLHLIFTFNKRGLGRIPRKENGFNQDQKNMAHFLANQIQVNYIPPSCYNLDFIERKHNIILNIINPDSVRHLYPPPYPPKKFSDFHESHG